MSDGDRSTSKPVVPECRGTMLNASERSPSVVSTIYERFAFTTKISHTLRGTISLPHRSPCEIKTSFLMTCLHIVHLARPVFRTRMSSNLKTRLPTLHALYHYSYAKFLHNSYLWSRLFYKPL